MPSAKDDQLAVLSQNVLKAFDEVNGGVHPGFRPAHAKGILLSGTFRPAADGAALTRAPHLHQPSTPVVIRFSDTGGLPTIPDNDPGASPHGIAIRFQLGADLQTDIVGHSVDGFPVRTAEELVEFLHALRASGPGAPKPTPVESFLAAHPAALRFVQAPKPQPVSFATESYFSVNAFKFTNQSGVSRFGRYRIRPPGGAEYLDTAAAAAKPADFLMDEIKERLARGSARLQILVQMAAAGDPVDDSTIQWPTDRPEVEFGTLELTAVVPNNQAEQRNTIFDPMPRVDGIESSGDPLIEARSAIYLASGRRRIANVPT
ncbi:MAG TPA: catalase family peroxidase [Candidatus Binataceae bacterium]|jgi:catalase|nr:catalase family peroxidase [Candidatus Binataceae bacterium]